MKKTIITYFLTACTFLFCASQKTTSYTSHSENGQHSIVINDDNGSLEVKYTGDISFSDDETAIKSISQDGYLKYKKNGKKIVVTADANGQIMYEINNGDKKSTLSADEKTFLTEAIRVMIEYGVGARDRVERIYKKGGSKAVMNETKNMKSDYVKSLYLEYLLETNTLSANEMTEIANDVHFFLQSDFEKGKLLKKFSAKYLSNDATAQAYLGAVKSINSDFEKANAVKAILNQPLTQEQFSEVLEVAKSINSDFEKSNVLKEALTNNKMSTAQFSTVLDATADIHSDFEKANVLKSVLANTKISSAQFSEVLNATSGIHSDFEKANVLKEILKNDKLPEAQFTETLSVISSVGSDFEKANVLKQLAGSDIKEEAHWISLISSTEKVSSDFEKSNVLTDIAAKMPASENVKSAYMKAAKTISSDFEYGKTIRALK
ncbi:MAG TPA: hypothetical protein VKT28_21745 [Puia sp.]|nr:hypothetical protein [Puia sp.]